MWNYSFRFFYCYFLFRYFHCKILEEKFSSTSLNLILILHLIFSIILFHFHFYLFYIHQFLNPFLTFLIIEILFIQSFFFSPSSLDSESVTVHTIAGHAAAPLQSSCGYSDNQPANQAYFNR